MAIQTKKFSPCKVNLMLAITNPRDDGFHDLVSLVCPTRLGDSLCAALSEDDEDSIRCDMPGVPCNSDNLVMRAAELFRRASGMEKYFDFDLEKRVPAGAGLGGGSSNGAAALLCANELCGNPLGMDELEAIAAEMGSDCPLFLSGEPIVMRGRGEKLKRLPKNAAEVLRGMRLLIFKPDFSINTGWAYKRMRENASSYIPAEEAEAALSQWLKAPSLKNLPLINNMQVAAFRKYPALPVVLDEVKKHFGLPAIMSGSGSACFAVINDIAEDAEKVGELKALITSMLGESCFMGLA